MLRRTSSKRRKILMKLRLAAALLGLAALTPSCLGPDNAYNSLKNWNANMSESDAVREIVFLGLTIIPVYGIANFVDVIVLNTIDYWTGSNPVSDPGAWPDNFTAKD